MYQLYGMSMVFLTKKTFIRLGNVSKLPLLSLFGNGQWPVGGSFWVGGQF